MTNAFSALSLKRNRSTSTTHTKIQGYSEPVSKLSKLKSGFSIFSKITDVITQQHQEQKANKRTSLIGLLEYFCTTADADGTRRYRLRRKATYDSDSYYEYHHYHKKSTQQIERNVHTLPTAQTKKLTSILIKRSGTNPQQTLSQPPLTKISSRRSNATHISISNITVNSEDLTAKEFADIAGIRILPEVEDDAIDEERKFSGSSSSNFTTFTEDVHMRTISTTKSLFDDERHSVISCTSIQSSFNSKPNIWDTEFWQNPEDNHQQRNVSRNNSTTTRRSTKATSNKQLSANSNNIVVVEPPILHELRKLSTRNSEKKKIDSSQQQLQQSNSVCVIKKGRFEIQLGDNGTAAGDPPVSNMATSSSNTLSFYDQQADGVLEWRRKKKE